MKLEYRNGLLFASIDIVFRGRQITVHDVIIDMGAAQTILSADAVDAVSNGANPETIGGIGDAGPSDTKGVDDARIS